uniref:Uncharacterized protein n=1 Tax=Klebsiella pneumoniae TaxID=573 RepID=A0A2P1BPF2_KLEPN|nr:hypothetical protein [Klebsiella pneumoniae]
MRAVRRKGVNEHGPVQMSGVSGKFFRPNEAAAEWPGKNYCERPCRPRTARRVVLVSAPANGLKRVMGTVGKEQAPAATTKARARNGVAPQSAGSPSPAR